MIIIKYYLIIYNWINSNYYCFNFYRKFDVNVFGIWNNLLFKIFVKIIIVKEELEGELVERYYNFFKYYLLDIEFGILIENFILK